MTDRRSPRAVLALLLLPFLLVACGGGDDGEDDGGAAAEPGTVRVVDNEFEPKTIEVAVGDTVTWSFEGKALHNVSGPGFKSKNLKDGTFEETFNSAGEVDYVCTLHPGMKGTVKVG
jgi:plastocyanin